MTGSGVAVASGVGVGDARLAEVAEPDPSLNASAAMIMATMSTPAAETAQPQRVPRRTRPSTRVGGCADPGRSGCAGAADDALRTAMSAPGARKPRSRPAPSGSMEKE